MMVTVIDMSGDILTVRLPETSPRPTLETNLDEWKKRGWFIATNGTAITWQAVARVIPEPAPRWPSRPYTP
jgi:hypothetical protein